MTSTEMDLVYEKLNEKVKLCEEDILKMFVEHQRLFEQQNDQAPVLLTK
jgi:hypothetical protein